MRVLLVVVGCVMGLVATVAGYWWLSAGFEEAIA